METILFGVIPVIAFMGLVARSVLRGRVRGHEDVAAARASAPPEYRPARNATAPGEATGGGGHPSGGSSGNGFGRRHGFDWTGSGR